jgi:hypothetical protein
MHNVASLNPEKVDRRAARKEQLAASFPVS